MAQTAIARKRTLLSQLGGMRALRKVVDALYLRVLDDESLCGFFNNVDIAHVKAQQVKFLAAALGGRTKYQGPTMKRAHAHLVIEAGHFESVARHFAAVLEEAGAPKHLIHEVASLVAPLEDEVVTHEGELTGSSSDAGDGHEGRETMMRNETSKHPTNGSKGYASAPLPEAARAEPESEEVLSALSDFVVVTDADFRVRVGAGFLLRSFEECEEELDEVCGCALDELTRGGLAKLFETDRKTQRALGDLAQLPVSRQLRLGEKSFALECRGMSDDGALTGYVVTIRDTSEVARLALEAARNDSMLASAPINIMFCDRDFVIRYANPASTSTLKTLEQYMPCKVSELIGQSIDIFHRNPAHQRKMLADPSNLPHNAVIEFGPEKLDLLVSPTFDDQGEYLGPMVTWSVVTQKIKTEREMARVNSMMENSPMNVMYADTNYVIQYMNPASEKTLRSIEQHLPVKVDEIIGQTFDVFHARPEHQRRIIGDPGNLPHQAEIKVGPETLELLVSAIYDNRGNYLGAMATWEVITEKLAQDQEREDRIAREAREAEDLRTKVGQILAVVSAAADGDLTQEVTVSGEDSVGQMGEALSRFFVNLRQIIGNIAGNASTVGNSSGDLLGVSQQMSSAAEETSAQATVVSAAAEEVSRNVQTVAAGIEELGASVREIAHNANNAASVATEAVSVAETTNKTVAELGESSAEIGKVVKVITSIAQQTNLLALNATIEAARAGEAGKGFAVVANEVKELAKETSAATEDIGRKIEAIQANTNAAVEAISRISTIINQINEIQSTIATAVEEQTATTNEISRNVADAARGSSEIAENITAVATAAQSTTEGAADTQRSASDLGEMAEALQSLVNRFTV